MDFLQDLNPQHSPWRRTAEVSCFGGGRGSGKTGVMTHRIAHLTCLPVHPRGHVHQEGGAGQVAKASRASEVSAPDDAYKRFGGGEQVANSLE